MVRFGQGLQRRTSLSVTVTLDPLDQRDLYCSESDMIDDPLAGDISMATRLAAAVTALSAVFQRRELIEVDAAVRTSKRDRKAAEVAGRRSPDTRVGKISLGKMGRRNLSERIRSGTNGTEHASERAAHWVRGHLFLARNGKLTWRRPHIRGLGAPLSQVRHVTE